MSTQVSRVHARELFVLADKHPRTSHARSIDWCDLLALEFFLSLYGKAEVSQNMHNVVWFGWKHNALRAQNKSIVVASPYSIFHVDCCGFNFFFFSDYLLNFELVPTCVAVNCYTTIRYTLKRASWCFMFHYVSSNCSRASPSQAQSYITQHLWNTKS